MRPSSLPACPLPQGGKVTLERRADLLQRAEPRVCAFDIGAWRAGRAGQLGLVGVRWQGRWLA